jgi:hypothetical protein
MYWRNRTLVSIWNVFQHEGFYRLSSLMTPGVDCLHSSLEGVKTFACIRACLTSIPESPISVNISWGLCPSTGCYRQRITNWCYGRLAAHEGQFQRTLKHLILLKGTGGCAFAEMFLKCKCFWIFLSNQPLFLNYVSSRCVYLYKVRVVLQRASASKGRWRWTLVSLKTNSPLFVSRCVSEVYGHEAVAARICWV